jgi:hypothetical protein
MITHGKVYSCDELTSNQVTSVISLRRQVIGTLDRAQPYLCTTARCRCLDPSVLWNSRDLFMQMNTVGKSTDFISTFFLYKIKNDKEYVTQKISVLSFLKSKYMR